VPTPGVDVKGSAGKLELERKFTPAQPENVVTKLGSYKAERLALATTGRVTLDTPTPTSGPPLAPMAAGGLGQPVLARRQRGRGAGAEQLRATCNQLTDAQLK